MREIPEMRCGEIRSDKMWSGDAFWPRPCSTLGVGHKNVHQARLGVMATRNQDYNIYIYCYCSCCYCSYTITTNTTTHTDISHNTIAALLLGYYTVMGSLLCGMGCRWDWWLRLYGPCERLKVHLLSYMYPVLYRVIQGSISRVADLIHTWNVSSLDSFQIKWCQWYLWWWFIGIGALGIISIALDVTWCFLFQSCHIH